MRLVRWLLLVGLIAVGSWYWFAPRRSYDRFLHAVAYADPAELDATIDFPQLRLNMREDIQAGLRRSGGTNLGTAITGAFLGTLVDAAVAPDGLAQILTGFGTRTITEAEAESLRESATTSFRYRSLSTVDVVLHPAGKPDQDGGILTFARSGLSWKLVRARGAGL